MDFKTPKFFHVVTALFSIFAGSKAAWLLFYPNEAAKTLLKENVTPETQFVMCDLAIIWVFFAVISGFMIPIRDSKGMRKGFQGLITIVCPLLAFVSQSMSNGHLFEEVAFPTILLLCTLVSCCLVGLSNLQGKGAPSVPYNFQLQDFIELLLVMPNFVMGLVMVSSPWSVLEALLVPAPSRSSILLMKLVGAGSLGITALKFLTIGNSNFHWRLATTKAYLTMSVLCFIKTFLQFGYRDIYQIGGQMILLAFGLFFTLLRIFSFYNFPEEIVKISVEPGIQMEVISGLKETRVEQKAVSSTEPKSIKIS